MYRRDHGIQTHLGTRPTCSKISEVLYGYCLPHGILPDAHRTLCFARICIGTNAERFFKFKVIIRCSHKSSPIALLIKVFLGIHAEKFEDWE